MSLVPGRCAHPLALALCAALVAVAASGCGGSDAGTPARSGVPAASKRGGELTMLWTQDVDSIDPGQTYYQMGFTVAYATQRPLFSWKPDDSEHPVPDLAAAPPEVAPDGCTVTVKLRTGVRFSPPVDRAVTAADVKYGIERGFFHTVNGGYVGAYFGDVRGAKMGAKPGAAIPGIATPDAHTVVFHLRERRGGKCTGGVLAGALAMPATAPVPADYAAAFDRSNPSSYGQHLVATGPYMVANDASGKAVGYQAGKRIRLVRNPSWDASTDYKPAYLDAIDMPQGNADTTVASRKVLEGHHLLSGDFSPPPVVLRDALRRTPDQLVRVPGAGIRWVALNTTIKPFDDVDVRRAVLAGFDRNAMRLTRGGAAAGDMPTHILNPGIPGFEEAGGMEGPGLDFLSHPSGDARLAASYFRKAGYPSGRYTGQGKPLLMVGTTGGVAQSAAEVAKENFAKLGFKVDLRLVTQDAMYTKFCNVPSAAVAICPNHGWLKDFSDPQTFLDPTFNGRNIIASNNANVAQLKDPEIDAAMRRAELLVAPSERARAWARIDTMISRQAPVIPWIWDRQPLLRSADVNGVASRFNDQWDLTFSSLR